MSSHHIVRDDQEPALIIANGEACSMELLNQLLEWNPLVIVLDSAITRVLDLLTRACLSLYMAELHGTICLWNYN